MASQNTNDQVQVITTVNTAPDNYIVATGTLETIGINVIGVGTKFLSEFVQNDWLFNGTDQVNQIDSIYSDLIMYLVAPFDVDITAGTAVNKVPASRTQQMGITATGSSSTVNGVAIPNGVSVNFGSDLDSNSVVDPAVVANCLINKGLKG